jgi:hypothetical protein
MTLVPEGFQAGGATNASSHRAVRTILESGQYRA